MKEAFKTIFPPGVPTILKWRLSMFAAVVAIGVHIAWACGFLASIGLSGFANASDIDKKIEPLRNDMAKIDAKVSALSEQIVQSLASSKASDIRQLASRRCRAKAEEKEAINREIDMRQDEYYRLTSRLYQLPTCTELQ